MSHLNEGFERHWDENSLFNQLPEILPMEKVEMEPEMEPWIMKRSRDGNEMELEWSEVVNIVKPPSPTIE